MPGHPRRTTELMSSTNRPTERKSRLAVPTRRTTQNAVPPGSTKRPQSVDRYSTRPHSLIPSMSTAKKPGRSQSQTPRSAYQTPTTPGNRTPMSNSYLQSADKRGMIDDKLFIHHEAAKITNFAICHSVQGFGKDTKLRNVTYKQFTGLVEYMLKMILGSRCPLEGIDNIMKALHTLEYPFTINKSWLKTPTAGHAFNHVVIMLGWLLNLVDPPLMPEGETELDDFECINNLVHDTEYPTIMYQKVFMEKAKEGFKMWNLQEDEDFEKLNEELANMVVAQSTNGDVTSIKRLDDDVLSLQKQQKHLMAKMKPSTNHQQYAELEKEVKDLKRALEGKREIVNQLMQSIGTERKGYEDERKILKQREAQINHLKTRIRNQIMSKEEIKQLIEKNYQLRQTLEAEQKSFKRLLDENVKEPVEVSQLIRQKVQKVNELNETMYTLAKNFEGAFPNFNPVELELNGNSPELQMQLTNLKPTFKVLKKGLVEVGNSYKASQIEKQSQIDFISAELAEYEKELKTWAENLALGVQKLNQTLADLEHKYTEIDGKYVEEKREHESGKEVTVRIKAEIETVRVAKEKVAAETQIIMKRFMEEHNKALEDVKSQVAHVDERLEYYKGVRDEIKKEATQKQHEIADLLTSLGYPVDKTDSED